MDYEALKKLTRSELQKLAKVSDQWLVFLELSHWILIAPCLLFSLLVTYLLVYLI